MSLGRMIASERPGVNRLSAIGINVFKQTYGGFQLVVMVLHASLLIHHLHVVTFRVARHQHRLRGVRLEAR